MARQDWLQAGLRLDQHHKCQSGPFPQRAAAIPPKRVRFERKPAGDTSGDRSLDLAFQVYRGPRLPESR